MNEHNGTSPLQLLEQGLEPLVGQIHAVRVGKEDDAIQLQDIERIGQLGESAIHIRQWQRGEAAKPLWTLLYHPCGKLVAAPRQAARPRIVSDMNPWSGDRGDCNINGRVVHQRQRARLIPRRRRDATNGVSAVVGLAPEKVRKNMMTNVDGEGHVSPLWSDGGLYQFSGAAADHV
jgi:hypothetical protein